MSKPSQSRPQNGGKNKSTRTSTQIQTPNWQPIERLALIAEMIDGMHEAATEQYQNLQEARPRPYVLDDHTVGRIISVYTTQKDGLWVFEEQLRRWGAQGKDKGKGTTAPATPHTQTTTQKGAGAQEEELDPEVVSVPPLTQSQEREVERLSVQMKGLHELVEAILALAEELKERTIEKMLAKSDLEVGLEALLGMGNQNNQNQHQHQRKNENKTKNKK